LLGVGSRSFLEHLKNILLRSACSLVVVVHVAMDSNSSNSTRFPSWTLLSLILPTQQYSLVSQYVLASLINLAHLCTSRRSRSLQSFSCVLRNACLAKAVSALADVVFIAYNRSPTSFYFLMQRSASILTDSIWYCPPLSLMSVVAKMLSWRPETLQEMKNAVVHMHLHLLRRRKRCPPVFASR
jgi:hypothetical protein